MDIAKSETFKNFIILNKALLFLIKLSKTAVQSVPKTKTEDTISFFVISLLLVPFQYVHTLRIEQSHPGSDARYVSG